MLYYKNQEVIIHDVPAKGNTPRERLETVEHHYFIGNEKWGYDFIYSEFKNEWVSIETMISPAVHSEGWAYWWHANEIKHDLPGLIKYVFLKLTA